MKSYVFFTLKKKVLNPNRSFVRRGTICGMLDGEIQISLKLICLVMPKLVLQNHISNHFQLLFPSVVSHCFSYKDNHIRRV